MAQLNNLSVQDVGVLKDTFENKISPVNPMASMLVGPSEELIRSAEHAKIAERLDVLEEKVQSIINKLNMVFGNSVLFQGRFVDISSLQEKQQ